MKTDSLVRTIVFLASLATHNAHAADLKAAAELSGTVIGKGAACKLDAKAESISVAFDELMERSHVPASRRGDLRMDLTFAAGGAAGKMKSELAKMKSESGATTCKDVSSEMDKTIRALKSWK